MEQENYFLLEVLDRPAFLVRDGRIVYTNQQAKNRQIDLNTPVQELIPHGCTAYEEFTGGCLHMTLILSQLPCCATVTRHSHGDLFLLDRDFDHTQLQTLALAAQQLRMPLSNIMTVADMLFPTLEENGQAQQAAQMRKGFFQLMRIIGNMADADRYLETSGPHLELTEIQHFFREIVEKASTASEDTQVTIRYTGLDRKLFSVLDRERVERAVFNLLANAVKFSPKGSTVTVKLTQSHNLLRLTVEDQGDGLATHVQGSVFTRYEREPGIEDSRFGLGLGMTLVRSVAAMHGGTVLVDQPNGGTRVTMTLAIRKTPAGWVHASALKIGEYTGGRDQGLLEFSESLPSSSYK